MQKNVKKVSLLEKFIISILIISLTMTNFFVVGESLVSYAKDFVLDSQTEATLNKNVKFDTYFKSDNGNTHYLVCDVNEQNSDMVLNLSVDSGYLKNAKIELQNPNYVVRNVVDNSEKVQDATNTTISLKQINAGEQLSVGLVIESNIADNVKLEDVSKDSKVVLKAIYVDEKGKEIELEKEVTLNISWTGNYETETNSELVKYTNFVQNGEEKVLVQVLAKANVKFDGKKLPVKENNIEVTVPSLAGANPEKVIVSAKSTMETNGKGEDTATIPEENIKIENGIAKIKIENKEENGNVWAGSGEDEIVLTYIYNKKDMLTSEMTIEEKVSSEISMYNGNNVSIAKGENANIFNLAETKGNVISLETISENSEISKGQMYANAISDNKQYKTEFNTKSIVEIAYKDLASELKIVDAGTYFKDENNNKYTISNVYYKNISISKANFEKILGTDGEIKILNENGNIISVINSTSTVNQDGNYTFDFASNYTNVIIETTKPIAEGNLCINSEKVIDGSLEYSKAMIERFASIDNDVRLQEKINNEFANVDNQNIEIALTETNTNANITLNKTTLSTIVNNEDVELKIELDNSREDSDMYVNGTFKVEFPKYIEDVNIKNYNILYAEGLNIKNINKQEENGQIVLYITLEGTEQGFSTGTVTNGTNIILGMDIKTELLTPSSKDLIKMYYVQDNAISYKTQVEQLGYAETEINFAAPTGMLAVNKISGYDETGKSIISVNQGTLVDKIKMDSDSKNAKMDLMLINNTGSTCDDVKVLGRIPFEGNKKIGTDEELQTTVNTTMIQGINIDSEIAQNAKIYYSENGEATDDLNNSANMWQETVEDFSKIKSYMIVFENYKLEQGQTINMSYNFIVPEMIDLNNSLYGTFGASYEKNSEIGTTQEQAVADVVGLTTGTGPKMNISQTVSVGENGVIQEGQIVKYTFSIKNEGNTDIENLKVKDILPDYSTYGEYKEPEGMGPEENTFVALETLKDGETGKQYVEFDIGTVKPEETVTKEILVKFAELPTISSYYADNENFFYDEESQKYFIVTKNEDGTYTEQEITSLPEITVNNILKITATDLELKTAEGQSNKIEKTTIQLSEKSSKAETKPLKENEEVTYTILVNNTTDKDINNVIVEKIIPEGLKYSKIYIEVYNEEKEEFEIGTEGTYDSTSRKASLTIPALAAGSEETVIVKATTEKLKDNEYSKTITSSSTVYEQGSSSKFVTTEVKNIVAKPKLVVNLTDNANGEYVTEGDLVIFKLEIKNEGVIDSGDISIIDELNEYFTPSSISYYVNNGEKSSMAVKDNHILLEKSIKAGETLTVELTVKAGEIPNDLKELTVENEFILLGDNIEKITSNKITKTIEQSTEPNKPDNGGNSGGNNSGDNKPEEIKTYKIKGTAWLDSNNNGQRESNEKLFGDIRVTLINAKTGDIILDRTTGKAKETTTSSEGKYEFDNLLQGEYIVVFYIDNTIYGVTEYAKSGVDSEYNSDVILTTMTENGEQKTVAVTNTIKIEEKSISGMDIGLVTNKTADLKLDKYVSTITVQNKDGVKTYNYSETTLAKLEIAAKRMSGSVVVAEYVMVVTNEGNIPMYAKNVVDYMPKDMKFNSDLNSNWYAGNDGNLYSTELANTVINPGESKNIKLVLTKTMTDNNTGISNNRAEIYEQYNELGLVDVDSTPGNQAQGEDDLGTANVIINVKTGEGVTYTCTILVGMVMLITGIYFIRKKTARYYN